MNEAGCFREIEVELSPFPLAGIGPLKVRHFFVFVPGEWSA